MIKPVMLYALIFLICFIFVMIFLLFGSIGLEEKIGLL